MTYANFTLVGNVGREVELRYTPGGIGDEDVPHQFAGVGDDIPC